MAAEIAIPPETHIPRPPIIEFSGTAAAALVAAIRLPLEYVTRPDFNENHTGITPKSIGAKVPADVFTELVDRAAALDSDVLAQVNKLIMDALSNPTSPDELLSFLQRDFQDYSVAIDNSSVPSHALSSLPRKGITRALNMILGLDYFREHSANRDRLEVLTCIPWPEDLRLKHYLELLERYDLAAQQCLPVDEQPTMVIAAQRQPINLLSRALENPHESYDPAATAPANVLELPR